jgi:hypothetical protein
MFQCIGLPQTLTQFGLKSCTLTYLISKTSRTFVMYEITDACSCGGCASELQDSEVQSYSCPPHLPLQSVAFFCI